MRAVVIEVVAPYCDQMAGMLAAQFSRCRPSLMLFQNPDNLFSLNRDLFIVCLLS